jgi:DNA-binding transcriptional ArsR family regulator
MKSVQVLPELDPLVHEPARLRLLVLLAMVDAADFMFLLREADMSRGNLSVQMRRLEEAGLVTVTKSVSGGRVRTSYELSPAGLQALTRYRDAMLDLLSSVPR